ncbi:DNA-processing protein DprA [Kushneria phosphatilytica]|uniref:DNA-protecting protein DprA n=1 Tax=Kushneria phosphatilytica TaxID=657387 RepID=A0A1S1NS15_9GAMM|nr:DNA-processing protein DprA [Kushneria phosphatilytica]OHV07854.1 DNA protecting protein DprA [Kushneria phosphatilytica]QEL10278.1 DNA-protecting protein DprA [Kushneria phosphatilytica]
MTSRHWLALSLLPKLGARRLAQIRQQQPSWPEGWLAALPGEARHQLMVWLHDPQRSPLNEDIERAMAWLEGGSGRHLLTPSHPAWPGLLDELPDPPPVLWGWGDLAALTPPALAMVGTRRPTREGRDNALGFSRALAEYGFTIVSGMALGIDGRAHEAALDAGGWTIAVLGCGVDVLYPRTHRRLRQRLLENGGLLLSEHLPGTAARAPFFPRRNRIITGLSLGVLVVEAARRSGSLVSARLAMEQNREVFALPGSLHNPQASGCLWLIQEGARLVTCRDELLSELPESGRVEGVTHPAPMAPINVTCPDDPLWTHLSNVPCPLDQLVELSGVAVSDCQQRLLMLELEGWAAQAPGGWVRRNTTA